MGRQHRFHSLRDVYFLTAMNADQKKKKKKSEDLCKSVELRKKKKKRKKKKVGRVLNIVVIGQ